MQCVGAEKNKRNKKLPRACFCQICLLSAVFNDAVCITVHNKYPTDTNAS